MKLGDIENFYYWGYSIFLDELYWKYIDCYLFIVYILLEHIPDRDVPAGY